MPHYLRYCKPLLSLKMKKIELFNVSLAKLALSNLAQLIYAFCLSSRICNNQKFSLTCVQLKTFPWYRLSVVEDRLFGGGGGRERKWRLVGFDALLMMTPSSLDNVWGRPPSLSKCLRWSPSPPLPKKKKGRRKKLSQIKRMKLNLNHSIARNASAPTPRWRVRPSWLKRSC